MLRRSIKFRCGRGNCTHTIEVNTDNLKEAEHMARASGWLVADKEWLYDLCPTHWIDEIQIRMDSGFEIFYNNKGYPRLKKI